MTGRSFRWALTGAEIYLYFTSESRVVTAAATAHRLGRVPGQTGLAGAGAQAPAALAAPTHQVALTKRRAVDYCRVAAALCPARAAARPLPAAR